MDLTGWLRRHATPRLFVVTARGGAAARLAVEREVRERGWAFAAAPAEADVLVVAGAPDAALQAAVARIWSAMPSPRARARVAHAADVAEELDQARAQLGDTEQQWADLDARGAQDDQADDPVAAGHDAQPGRDGPAGHDGHSGHEMHMMHGGVVAGLPMAERAADRDGLTLDRLHVSLGPALSDWPAGLVVRLALQGDVVQSAEVATVGEGSADGSPFDDEPVAAALDSLARLLAVCGWDTAARRARRLRDESLAGVVDMVELRRFADQVRRSGSLRWATDGLGWLDETHGVLAGDATQRWRRWIDVLEHPDRVSVDVDRAGRARVVLEVLPGLVEGQELAAARVVVASLDPDLDALDPAPADGAFR